MIRSMRHVLVDLIRIAAALSIAVIYNAELLGRLVMHLPVRDRDSVRLRLTLERLGTTYLKLGQFLAMRFDLLPRPLCDELQKLFEHVPSLPFATIRGVIEQELGAPIAQLFADIDPQPIGSASIAQVHRATGLDGQKLAIKVQRPEIAEKLTADMRALGRLAAMIDRLGVFPGLSLSELVGEFAAFTQRELDFVREAATAMRLREHRTAHETVPRIHLGLSSSRVLAMDFIDGLSIAEAARLQAAGRHDLIAAKLPGFEPGVTLHHFAMASLHQLFGTGFFHADPHPGNILLLANNRIAFIDFGIFGNLNREKRELLMAYTESAATGDIGNAWYAFARLSTPTDRTDMRAYRQATAHHLSHWYQTSLLRGETQPHIGELVGQLTDIMRRHHVRIDLETLLFWRAVIALDSSALTLCPEFDLAAEIRLYFAAARLSPAQRMLSVATDRIRIAALTSLLDIGPHAAAAVMATGSDERPLVIARRLDAAGNRAGDRMARIAIGAVIVVATGIALSADRGNLSVNAFAFEKGRVAIRADRWAN